MTEEYDTYPKIKKKITLIIANYLHHYCKVPSYMKSYHFCVGSPQFVLHFGLVKVPA